MQNVNEVIEQFKEALYNGLGYAPNTIIPDGVLHRFKDEKGKLSYWYNLHIDGRAAGVFGCWKTGVSIKWKLEGDFPPLSDQDRMNYRIERHRQDLTRKAEEQAKHDKAAKKALYIWEHSEPVTLHPYLTKKGIKPHNSRLNKGALVLPIYNKKQLVSLQFVNESGEKKMLSGGLLKGSYCVLGHVETITPESILLICEGWATGCTLHDDTGFIVFVAFSAGNLKAVAIQVREHYPSHNIIVCGDNDASSVGQLAANDAALEIDGKVSIPPDLGDWNDYALMLKGEQS